MAGIHIADVGLLAGDDEPPVTKGGRHVTEAEPDDGPPVRDGAVIDVAVHVPQQELRIEIVERQITELAVLTDGLQMLALDFGQARVHDRFFAPLFKTVKNVPGGETLRVSLLEFMDSKRVNDRTDDDKTLLLATRSVSDVPQNLPDAVA